MGGLRSDKANDEATCIAQNIQHRGLRGPSVPGPHHFNLQNDQTKVHSQDGRTRTKDEMIKPLIGGTVAAHRGRPDPYLEPEYLHTAQAAPFTEGLSLEDSGALMRILGPSLGHPLLCSGVKHWGLRKRGTIEDE